MKNTTPTLPHSRHRLDLLYRLAQTFNSSLDLDQVLNSVMDEVITTMKAERGFVMLLNDDGELEFKIARGIDQRTIDDPQFQVSRSILKRVIIEGKPILTNNAQMDARFNTQQSVRLLGLRSILCVPLILKGKTLGVIYVDNHLQSGIFKPSDRELLLAIASNAAIAIENARLYQLAVEKGRLERELQMARQVQTNLLPKETPQISGWEFAATWQPARQVAGDYYDFIPFEDGRLGVIIADVSDKGMPAALFMAMTRAILRASLTQSPSPSDGIAHANRLLCQDSTNCMFVTLFYAQIDPTSGLFTYVNAGHNPPIYYHHQSHSKTGQLARLSRTGMALGVMEDATFQENVIRLSEGECLLLYTDGLTDTFNLAGESFSIQSLELLLTSNPTLSAKQFVSHLMRTIQNFSANPEPFDDLTLIYLKRCLPGQEYQ